MPIGDYVLTNNLRADNLLVAISPFPFLVATALFILIKDNYQKMKLNIQTKKFMSYTSNIIFYIYMIHVIVMEIVKKCLLRFINPDRFIVTSGFIVIEFILTFAISYILSMLLNYLYNKTQEFITKKKTS